ncbi:MAG: hypothetical protein JWM18_1934 [Chloroflexi bacterium]|jgi:hypothetical protein|nr:hypothetical protein [Chloroflexota bacterium]MDB5113828.1 hypothetical protein [Chloroflexota bacterium]MEA2617812.1 hypothetical protein [Chloroflexota bacterium]HEV7466698.1 hypothetical protein [Candidatus Dormibacteraeota bacterium]
MSLTLAAIQTAQINLTTETVAAGLAGGLAGVVMTKMPMWTSAGIGAALGLVLYILGCRV